MKRVVTIVLRRDGRHQHTIDCSLEDAQRWADEGYEVFRLVVSSPQWALNHVNTGKIVTSESPHAGEPQGDTGEAAQFLLPLKG